MRRSEKEIVDQTEIEAILQSAVVCRLALSDGMIPYVVPLHYGYSERILYFHSAASGRKIEILRKNQNVCVEFETDIVVKPHEHPCKWATSYKSVIASGKAVFIESPEEKAFALNCIMRKYAGRPFEFSPEQLNAVTVFKVIIESMSGKRS